MTLPTAINALGTPNAVVSPSLAPVRVNASEVHVLGFKDGKDALKVCERCLTMGVPLPIVTDPAVLTAPVLATLKTSVPVFCPLKISPLFATLNAPATPVGRLVVP